MTESEPKAGAAVYDDPALLDAYLAHRHRPITSPNLVMEDPAFMAEAGDLTGLRILDLGCGDGTFARRCRQEGCASYTGVDGSTAMLDQARRKGLDPAVVEFEHADIERFQAAGGSFDLVISRMALHYVEDIRPVFAQAHDALVSGGRLLITVLHPVVSAQNEASDQPRTTQVVDRYFCPGPREHDWFGRQVVWHHRTIEHYLSAMAVAGFSFRALKECAPVEALFDGDHAEFERRRRVPLFLLLHGVRTR